MIQQISIKPGSYPRLLSPWRLRNDIKNVVLYTCDTEELKHKVLSPYEASIIPFFNGQNSIEEIHAYWNKIHQPERINPQYSLDNIISNWVSDGIVGFEGAVSPSMKGNPKHFIPDFSSYQYPTARLVRPISIAISPTNNCHTNCVYCYAERRRCKDMSLEELDSIFDELAENEIYIVDISGGDFFTHPDAISILKSMVEKDFIFFLSTKCHISERTAEALSEMRIGYRDALPHLKRPIQISIDSADPKTAAFLCGPENYLERAVSSAANMIKTGLSPRIKSVLTSFNADAPNMIVKLFSDIGVDNFHFVQYGRSFYRNNDSLFLNEEQKLRLVEIMKKLRQDYPHISIEAQEDVSTLPGRKMTIDKWNSRSICSGGRTSMKIQPNGDVTLCDQLPHNVEFTVGNVIKQGIMNVWNSDKLIGFINPPKRNFRGTVCFNCNDFERCHYQLGYCYRDAYFNFGTQYEAPPGCPFQMKVGLREI